jgi:4-amino-4-deoxy-L-arabinose transferase-like glycosyltransferase
MQVNPLARRVDWLLVALLVVVTLLALPVLTYPLGRDQGEFATIGRGILDGRVPYRELWNPKPPAVFYVYALAIRLFGRTVPALRAIDLLIVPLIDLALYWIGRRVTSRKVGLWAALAFSVFYFTETFWTLTQNDGIVLLPMLLAVVCLLKTVEASERSRFGLVWPFLAGTLAAYVTWFKYPFALFGVLLVTGYFLLANQRAKNLSRNPSLNPSPYTERDFETAELRPFPDTGTNGLEDTGSDEATTPIQQPSIHVHLRTAAAFVLGGLLVGGGGLLYLASIGALNDLIESARVTSQYTALTFNAGDFSGLMQTALYYRWQQWGLLFALAALGLLLAARGRRWLFVLLWALAGVMIMLVQAKGYDYHWLPMLPPLALLAAGGIDTILRTTTRILPRAGVIVLTGVAALGLLAVLLTGLWPKAWPYLTGREDQVAYFSHFQAGEFVADESLKVAQYLRARVAKGDSLFIWGFRPEVYYLSGLNPGARFIFQFPLVGSWYPQTWRQETVDTLWASMPPYALVLQVDYMPWVTGSHDDSNTLLQSYTDLNNWLIANYERETQIGNFFIWKRKR